MRRSSGRRTAAVLAVLALAAACHPATATTLMRTSAHGAPVRDLQARLTQLGLFPHSPTGYYATETATALRAFQKQAGLPPTGEFTTADRSALLSRTHKPEGGEPHPRNSGREAP
ncbi:hypothetical protein GCM10010211_62270 [Streptomyces albospinus]|uniref:Peptidoglycan binding-like domain-containing protein n=1 Tax=Streptomyces albospinus TaxID=285515 RepID=A0ABQ2VKU9_9ACTN|nr:peptidoglycan-binding domain-containing protein [Streptomyces albospinus]GGU87667.1 hypothetical protein GCM10010211_62270 [Streptomyces albospinus]